MNRQVCQVVIGGLLVLSSGCILPITVAMPTVRFTSPEAEGGHARGFVGFGLATNQQLTAANPRLSPPSPTRSFDRGPAATLSGEVGILRRLDLEVVATGSDATLSPFLVRAKYQFKGPAAGEDRKKGRTSVAATVGVGYAHEIHSDSAQPSLGPSLSNSVESTASVIEAGLSLGHRPKNWLLVYGGPSVAFYRFQSAIDQTANGQVTRFDVAGNAQQFALNLGVQANRRVVFLRGEVSLTKGTSGSATGTTAAFGLQFGFRWR